MQSIPSAKASARYLPWKKERVILRSGTRKSSKNLGFRNTGVVRGGTGGNIRCGHVCIFFLVQVFLPLHVVSGDPAADVVSSLRDTPIVIRPFLFSPTPLSRPLRRPLRPFYVQIYISRALWLSCMMSMGLALIAEAAFQ